MRRPAVFTAASFGTGIFLSYHLEIEMVIWLVFLTGALAFFVWMILRKSVHRMICLCLCFAAAGGCWLSTAEIKYEAAKIKEGEAVCEKGIIQNIEEKDDCLVFTMHCGDTRKLVRYYGDKKQLKKHVGRYVIVRGTASMPQGRRNPGCFDYSLYLKSCSIDNIIYAEKIVPAGGNEVKLISAASVIRDSFGERLRTVMDEEYAGLVMAVMFGDKSGLEEDLYNRFRDTGTAHVLAVSGLHIGILYSVLYALWRWKKGSGFYLATAAVLLLYMALADFSPSVVRASVMIIIHAAACISKRRYDLLSAASVTFMMMLLYEPFQLFNAGFQLSFIAVSSIGVLLPYIESIYSGVFLASLSVQIGMTPYTAFVFNNVSVLALIVNVPVIFITGIMMPVGLCALISMLLPEKVFAFLSAAAEISCKILIWVNDAFYADGAFSVDVTGPPVWTMVIYYGLLILCVSEEGQILRKNSQEKVLFVLAAVIISAVFISGAVDDGFRNAEITFVDVGQGACVHIRTDDGKNYIIDGGGKADYDVGEKVLKPYLLKNGVRKIEAAFVTHLHEDHYGGIKSIAKEGMIRKIGVYDGNRKMEKILEDETDTDVFFMCAGQRVRLGDGIFLNVIWPEQKPESEYDGLLENENEENRMSLVFLLEYEGLKVLIAGDIDAEGEKELMEDAGDLQCEILQVPHHGSRYSSTDAFIAAAGPDAAVFQVGKNIYGHPSDEVITKYRDAGSLILRNDTDGAVGFFTDRNGDLKVLKMID